jgi:hypothetical protein
VILRARRLDPDRHLAEDVVWGSPFGATVRGYEPLHDIHVDLKKTGVGGPSSRFEVVQMLAPAPEVAVAQVRRVAIDTDPESDAFSEMALYVLVKRGGTRGGLPPSRTHRSARSTGSATPGHECQPGADQRQAHDH